MTTFTKWPREPIFLADDHPYGYTIFALTGENKLQGRYSIRIIESTAASSPTIIMDRELMRCEMVPFLELFDL